MRRFSPRITAATTLLAGLLATVLGGFVHAAADAAAVARLDRFFDEVETLEGRFAQEVIDERGEATQRGEGRVWLARPGRFRWEYEKPYPQMILADGERLWIYDKELEQVTVKPQREALGAAPIALLDRRSDLEAQFEIRSVERRGELEWITLEPVVKDTEFVRVRMGLDGAVIRRMELLDQFGQTTRIVFSDLQVNRPLDPEVFRFDPPEGVDVLGLGDGGRPRRP
jgi:outer membrane lipoprotein carrier protein